MKKIKLAMISVAIILAVGGAFATRPKVDCTSEPQFFRFGLNTYLPAGEYGMDYTCISSVGVCTYYRPAPITNPNYYLPCRIGFYWAAE
jgi:hypothetical protein